MQAVGWNLNRGAWDTRRDGCRGCTPRPWEERGRGDRPRASQLARDRRRALLPRARHRDLHGRPVGAREGGPLRRWSAFRHRAVGLAATPPPVARARSRHRRRWLHRRAGAGAARSAAHLSMSPTGRPRRGRRSARRAGAHRRQPPARADSAACVRGSCPRAPARAPRSTRSRCPTRDFSTDEPCGDVPMFCLVLRPSVVSVLFV
jgi:hypothetical protein